MINKSRSLRTMYACLFDRRPPFPFRKTLALWSARAEEADNSRVAKGFQPSFARRFSSSSSTPISRANRIVVRLGAKEEMRSIPREREGERDGERSSDSYLVRDSRDDATYHRVWARLKTLNPEYSSTEKFQRGRGDLQGFDLVNVTCVYT